MFVINGIEWELCFVSASSDKLRRSDNSITVGVTDWGDRCVYVADALYGAFLRKVLCHELCHCFCFSYDIHMPIEQEEYLANWISLYGEDLIYLLDDLMETIMRRIA